MDILNKKQKTIVIVIVIIMLIFIVYYVVKKVNNLKLMDFEEDYQELNIIETEISEEKITEIPDEIIVHVSGAVKKDGIIKIEKGARISEVIEKAGGVTDEADISKINLAYMVQDGQKINVPNINVKDEIENITDDAGKNVVEESSNLNSQKKVNINTASQTELETLNGIGTSTALKIINYREQNGKFNKIEDLKNVPGIGDSKFESIKNEISI